MLPGGCFGTVRSTKKQSATTSIAPASAKRAGAVKRFHNRLIDAWDAATAGGSDVTCDSFSAAKPLRKVFTPELLRLCKNDLAEADSLADDERIKERIAFYRRGLKYTELTLDAVNATIKLNELGIDMSSPKEAKRKIDGADRELARKLIGNAHAAWQIRDAYVEKQ